MVQINLKLKGRSKFTKEEADVIIELIRLKLASSSTKQKGIRAKIRRLGFFASDSGLGGGYDEQDFLNAVQIEGKDVIQKTPKNKVKITSVSKKVSSTDILLRDSNILMNPTNFKLASNLDGLVPALPGIYAIRIKDPKKLPAVFAKELGERNHNLLYIGIASKSLKKRMLGQELRAKGHGTFFRSLGALLGYTPPKGSLVGAGNIQNYKFTSSDETKIIQWINENLLINWILMDNGWNELETQLILSEKPLMNIVKNPLKLTELSRLRARCVEIANQ